MFKGIVALCSALIISACTLGPDYRRPTMDIPSSWRFEEKEARDAANTAWWGQFEDPVLNELITMALKENLDLKTAALRVEEFIGRYGLSRSGLFPQVSATGIAQRKSLNPIHAIPHGLQRPTTPITIFRHS